MDSETRQALERDAHFSYTNLLYALCDAEHCLEHHLGIIGQLPPATNPAVLDLKDLQDHINSVTSKILTRGNK